VDETAKRDSAGGLAHATLFVYGPGGVRAVRLPSRGTLIAGRSAPADLVIDDASVSREHARFAVGDGRTAVEDLGSTNGTFVRGQRVDRAVLSDGVEIRLGDVVVLFRDPASAALQDHDLDPYDELSDRLDEELARCRVLRHLTSVVAVDTERRGLLAVSTLLRSVLRPIDRVGVFGAGLLLVVLPETGPGGAPALRKLLTDEGLRFGMTTVDAGTGDSGAAAAIERAVTALRGDVPPEATTTGPVFRSAQMLGIVAELRRVAQSQISVLLRGETGTGKDVLATLVHEASHRSGPLCAINCAAIAPSLLEATLFGYERGAFTGADRAMPGLFEQADGGSLFLDEIGELSAAAQAALLRVLESRRVQRLGSTKPVAIDVRIIAATHVDLVKAAAAKSFREDLFYRLEGFGITIPPLRERRDDLEPLVATFIREGNQRHQRTVTGITPLARDVLHAYAFPGNIRELRNAIERAIVVARNSVIDVSDLPERMRAPLLSTSTAPESSQELGNLRERVRTFERQAIHAALRACGGSRKDAAEALGLPLRSLFYKLKELGET